MPSGRTFTNIGKTAAIALVWVIQAPLFKPIFAHGLSSSERFYLFVLAAYLQIIIFYYLCYRMMNVWLPPTLDNTKRKSFKTVTAVLFWLFPGTRGLQPIGMYTGFLLGSRLAGDVFYNRSPNYFPIFLVITLLPALMIWLYYIWRGGKKTDPSNNEGAT